MSKTEPLPAEFLLPPARFIAALRSPAKLGRRLRRAAAEATNGLALVPGGKRLVRVLPAPLRRRMLRRMLRRSLLAASTELLFGDRPARGSTRLVRWVFLRGLGLVYLAAFTSLRVQVLGLYGRRGILPVHDLLAGARALPRRTRWRRFPTVFWLDDSDKTLLRACRAGQVLSAAVLLNAAPRPSLAALWGLHLSFNTTGGDFHPFQWDALLLESGLDAVLVAPGGLRPGVGAHDATPAARLLMRSLVFKLYFQSGTAKLQSRDPTWRDLTALRHHYETQPLPTRLGWRAHQLPPRLQRASTAATLALECVVPFFAFGPAPLRRSAAGLLTGLQGLIAATGNYAFFNLLSVVLHVWLLDDEALGRVLRARRPRPARRPSSSTALQTLAALPLAVLSGLMMASRQTRAPVRLLPLLRAVEPLMSVNNYGLFAVMTTARPEIAVEGSDDGEEWKPYEFRWKPGDPRRPPRVVAPHQPRLDWQMWFAALQGSPPPWFVLFLVRLLQGSPEVLALLKTDPFAGRPPKHVRARLFDYRMTDRATRRRTGEWWTAREIGIFCPPLSLEKTARRPAWWEPAYLQ